MRTSPARHLVYAAALAATVLAGATACTQSAQSAEPRRAAAAGAPASTSPGDPLTRYRAPDCSGNNPATGRIDTCARAYTTCPPPQLRMRLWTAPAGTTVGSGTWTQGQSLCVGPEPSASASP